MVFKWNHYTKVHWLYDILNGRRKQGRLIAMKQSLRRIRRHQQWARSAITQPRIIWRHVFFVFVRQVSDWRDLLRRTQILAHFGNERPVFGGYLPSPSLSTSGRKPLRLILSDAYDDVNSSLLDD